MEQNMNINNSGTYVAIKVENSEELIEFCMSQGLLVSKPDDLHVTIAYSTKPFIFRPALETINIVPGKSQFGIMGGSHLVLMLDSIPLQCEHHRTQEAGASYDYPNYNPHITIEYDCGDIDFSHLQNPDFDIILSGEYIEPLDPEWVENK